MPSLKWHHVWAQPVTTLKLVAVASALSFKEILARVCFPFRHRPLRLRNALVRLWLGTAFSANGAIFYSDPVDETVQSVKVEQDQAEVYLVPTLARPSVELQAADAVVLFAHGGGMIMGHPLQYLDEYRRWVRVARQRRRKVVFVAFKYPLSVDQKWPAQRSAMLAAYKWVLSQGVLASKIAFAGDSAGGNLAVLTLLHLRDLGGKIPMPACTVLMSPWVDMTGEETMDSPNFDNDFMFQYNQGVSIMNNALRPARLPFNTPEISAILAKNVGGLPPQLIFYSPTELLASDSERWIKRSQQAGVDTTTHARPGEMHTFAVGWPVSTKAVYNETDEVFISYVLNRMSHG